LPDIRIPTGLDDLTPEWLSAVLAPHYPGRVAALDVSPIGTGQIADSARLGITWDDRGGGPDSPAAPLGVPGAGPLSPDARPDSLVAKVTAASEDSRQAGLTTRTYEVEVGFYSSLAADLPVRTPRCYWAGFDPAEAAYCVVLEDVAPAHQGDQVGGCSTDEAAAALDELALLHAPRWGDPTLAQLSWLQAGGRDRGAGIGAFLSVFLPGFLERYATRMTPEVVELIPRFLAVMERYGTEAAAVAGRGRAGAEAGGGAGRPSTVLHGDFRNDNLMFGLDRVVVLDWQTVTLGAALSDVSYFLGGSLLPDIRRSAERDLVRHYWDRLAAHGVDLDWERCWEDYRRYAFAGLIMAMFASMVVTRTERGDAMFVAMADRAGLHALDMDALSLVPKEA